MLFDLPLSLRSVISASESTVLFFLNLHLDWAYNSKLANKWHKNTKVLTDSGITIRLVVWFNGRWTIFMTCKYCEKTIDQSSIRRQVPTTYQRPVSIPPRHHPPILLHPGAVNLCLRCQKEHGTRTQQHTLLTLTTWFLLWKINVHSVVLKHVWKGLNK